LTKRGQFEVAEEILKHVLLSVVYRSREFQSSIRLAIISELLRIVCLRV
jgi:general transcription factor 3C polypeptide 3 (transcription factor C subunit 4)